MREVSSANGPQLTWAQCSSAELDMVDTERSPAAERGPGVLYWKTTREREREREREETYS